MYAAINRRLSAAEKAIFHLVFPRRRRMPLSSPPPSNIWAFVEKKQMRRFAHDFVVKGGGGAQRSDAAAVLKEKAGTTASVDGNNLPGPVVVGNISMSNKAIGKAGEAGIGWVVAKGSIRKMKCDYIADIGLYSPPTSPLHFSVKPGIFLTATSGCEQQVRLFPYSGRRFVATDSSSNCTGGAGDDNGPRAGTRVSQRARAQDVALYIADKEEASEARLDGKLDEKFGKIDEKFGKIDEKFGKIDEKFGKIDEKFGKIDAKLEKVHEAVGKIGMDILKVFAKTFVALAGILFGIVAIAFRAPEILAFFGKREKELDSLSA